MAQYSHSICVVVVVLFGTKLNLCGDPVECFIL